MKKVAFICSLALIFLLTLMLSTPQPVVAQQTPPVSSGCQADLNGDGAVTTADLLIWLACYECGSDGSIGDCPHCSAADFNNDHKINWMDYQILLNELNANCGS